MDPDLLWRAFGAWGFSTILLLGAIRYLHRELAATREKADKRADETLAIAERVLPVLAESSTAVRDSTDLLRRQGEALAAVEVLIRDLDRRGRS